MRATRLSLVAFALLLPCCPAPAGLVRTLDGKSFTGAIQFDNSGALTIVSREGRPQRVEWTNVLCATFTEANPSAAVTEEFPADPAKDGELPAPWRHGDVGEAENLGRASYRTGGFTVEAYRRLREEKEDGFHFVYQTMKGDGEIIARVAAMPGGRAEEKRASAGVMMKAGLAADTVRVMLALREGGGATFRRRHRSGGNLAEDNRPEIKPPWWVRLVREGKLFTGYLSRDGKVWQLLDKANADMPETVHLGLAVINQRETDPVKVTFDRVAVRGATPRRPIIPQVVLRNGTVIADHLVALDGTSVIFSGRRRNLSVSANSVARILFEELDNADALIAGRIGVLLSNRDFIEGEFKGIEDGKVKVSSVLFGLRSYALHGEVAAVALREVAAKPAAFQIKTRDGSVLGAASVAFADGTLGAEVPLAGSFQIAAADLVEVSRAAER